MSGTHYAALKRDSNRCLQQVPVKTRSTVFALLVLGLAACGGLSSASGSADRREPTVVEVNNQSFLDMTVFAVRNSQRVRLGNAGGNTRTRLTVPPSLVSGLTPVRFIADPIGSDRASVSQEILVAPGDTVVLTIPPS
jgi:hypothetical protein